MAKSFDRFGFGCVKGSPSSGWAIRKRLQEFGDIIPKDDLSPSQLALPWASDTFKVLVRLEDSNVYVPYNIEGVEIVVLHWY